MENSLGRFEKYIGQEREAVLPEQIEGKPLGIVASKAFLSCKSVERLVLPASLEIVEDWGFAHMKNLREIVLPAKEIAFGRQVFLGCESLERVVLYRTVVERFHGINSDVGNGALTDGDAMDGDIHKSDDSVVDKCIVSDGLQELRATMFRYFPQEHLENMALFGDEAGQKKWLSDYDDALEIYLKGPNDIGFEPAFIGWFDVEDVDDQKERFILQRKKDKLRLAMQRILVEEQLRGNIKQKVGEFQLEFETEQGGLEESLLGLDRFKEQLLQIIVLYTEFLEKWLCEDEICGRDIRYYKVWKESGALTLDVIDRLLVVLPWEEPEVRAFLMESKLSEEGGADFFETLNL